MVDTGRLTELISKSGVRKELIAGAAGMSIGSLNNKLAGRTAFYIEEANVIKALLNLDQKTFFDVFFASEVGNEPTGGERA